MLTIRLASRPTVSKHPALEFTIFILTSEIALILNSFQPSARNKTMPPSVEMFACLLESFGHSPQAIS